MGAFEWLEMDESLRDALFQSSDPNHFMHAATNSDRWHPLVRDATAKARAGLTTVEEVLRITKVAVADESAAPELEVTSASSPAPTAVESHE